MPNQNIEITKKGYAAFNAGDLETALSVFDDTVEWTIPGDSAISGTHRGQGELTELMAKLAQKTTSVEAKSFLADGDVVVVQTEVTAGGETSVESGIGTRAGGADGIRKYCRPQAITSPRIPTAAKELLWYPSSPRRVKVALAVMRAGAARGLRRFGVSRHALFGRLCQRGLADFDPRVS